MRRFNPEKELYKIQHGNRNKIIFGVLTLLIIIAIGSSYALYQVRYSKRIIYTKVAPFSTSDLNLAVIVNGEKQTKVPEKDKGYKYVGIECDDGYPTAEWDEEKWNFKQISDINVPNKCNVYFSNIIQEYNLTNSIVAYTVPKDGVYRLEVWGGQGGTAIQRCPGGLGGYSVGNTSLKKNDVLYIVVGSSGYSNGQHVYQEGGYNGGGSATPDSDSNTRQASGGGATHIATATGLLSTLENNKGSILIVAGGGGGSAGGGHGGTSCTLLSGGTGGGLQGGDGVLGANYQGFGGTQSAGGTFFGSENPPYTCTGSFGAGCGGVYAGSGGGYYGGGVASNSNGGGSGYLNADKLIKGTTKTINGINEGDGKARISYIKPSE